MFSQVGHHLGRWIIGLQVFFVCTSTSYGVTLDFANRTWVVKQSTGLVGPGPNRFSSSSNDVWLDQEGLHLTIQKTGPYWYSTEVILNESLGYGTYMFQTSSRQDILDANAVFGAFTWDPFGGGTIPGNANREIDFEDSRWGDPADPTNSQIVVQPYYVSGNLDRITLPDLSDDPALTRYFTWSPGMIEFTTLRGHHSPTDYLPENVIHQYTYTDNGSNHRVPVPGQEAFRFNLWLFASSAPAGNQRVEVVVNDFQYTPLAITPTNDTVLFDFESGSQGWESYGAITSDSGNLPGGGSEGQGRYHTADYSLPDASNFGIVDVSPSHQNLSQFQGLSVDALLRDVAGEPAFVGTKNLNIVVATGSGATEEEFFAPVVTMTDTFQTFNVYLDNFLSSLTSLPPTLEDLSDVTIKLIVYNESGTGTAQLVYDQITGLSTLENADFDLDGDVDGRDFLIWQRGFGVGTTLNQGDANNSGAVDADDLAIWQSQYGIPNPSTAKSVVAIPEPSACPLALAALLSCTLRASSKSLRVWS